MFVESHLSVSLTWTHLCVSLVFCSVWIYCGRKFWTEHQVKVFEQNLEIACVDLFFMNNFSFIQEKTQWNGENRQKWRIRRQVEVLFGFFTKISCFTKPPLLYVFMHFPSQYTNKLTAPQLFIGNLFSLLHLFVALLPFIKRDFSKNYCHNTENLWTKLVLKKSFKRTVCMWNNWGGVFSYQRTVTVNRHSNRMGHIYLYSLINALLLIVWKHTIYNPWIWIMLHDTTIRYYTILYCYIIVVEISGAIPPPLSMFLSLLCTSITPDAD